MNHISRVLLVFTCLYAGAPLASGQTTQPQRPVAIVSAGPTGEIASLAEANEIRIVFSEPMVTLGRIPTEVRPPFVRITPAIRGTYRWSGTTILIFTPDQKQPLPYATRYDVVVSAGATAVSGRRLNEDYSFSFTTPTVKLLRTNWYRRGGRADAPIVVLLRFNQRVRLADVLGHLTARFHPHAWQAPVLAKDLLPRLNQVDPDATARFEAKVRATRAAASANTPVTLRPTEDWDRKLYPPGSDLVVLETTTPVPAESWIELDLGEKLPSPAGDRVPGSVQTYTIQVEPAFFVNGFRCRSACDPDSANHLEFRRDVRASDFASALRVADITDPSAPRAVEQLPTSPPRRDFAPDARRWLTLEDGGFASQSPARTYEVVVDANLRAEDGQILGYTWIGSIENWHQRPFTSFGDGHGVWETGGGAMLPFYARNYRSVTQWAAPVALQDLMPTLVMLQPTFRRTPAGPGAHRALGGAPDRIQSHGLDLAPALGKERTGLIWAAVQEGEPIERAPLRDSRVRASVVQVTNLGITVKDSPRNTLVFVTRLDNGAPVAGAKVSIIRLDNQVFWSGTTGADGVAIAPETPLRDEDEWYKFSFIVTAEKDGDVAYVGSDWNEGLLPWEFGSRFNLAEATPLLRGTVFSDRGVYRLGEEVHFKAVLRQNTADGIRLLPEGTPVVAIVRDGQYRIVDERVVNVNSWSAAEWKWALPAEGSLGNYQVQLVLETDRPKPRGHEDLRPWETPGPRADAYVPHTKTFYGGFLVAAYRRPDFRVDVTLAGNDAIAGDELKGVVSARYLFGAAMGVRPLHWTFSKSPLWSAPPAVTESFPEDRWTFVGWSHRQAPESGEIRRDDTELTATGQRELSLQTRLDAGVPYSYTLEGDVEDVSRQHIANRASLVVHPAPWYIGLKRHAYFVQQQAGLQTEIVAVSPTGAPVAGVPVIVTLTQIQWISVRRAEGNGFYTWDTERKEVPAGSWTVTTGREPVPLEIPLANGGYFVLEAVAREENGRFAVTSTSFYALGDGYTAWARFDHNRIELVPEKKTYRPGETARIMIQSPWEQATALVTTEREGIRSHRQFALTSTQQSVSIPISERDIPNVYVSVLLIRGRTQVTSEPVAAADSPRGGPYSIEDTSDPGKPSFRLGYVELQVEDVSKRLSVAVKANKEEYRPANTANVRLLVKDPAGRGVASEVTLWAVDYGVLSLTAYRAPDVVRSVYVDKALQVLTEDSRQRIISRRVLTPKGETDGGGGGGDAGAGTMRRDFRVLAFWLGSVLTNAEGEASVEVKLPESLTTYRIMAVAGDRASRFGSGEADIRINKPLTLKPTFPRFLAVGDRAYFGAVVTSQLASPGQAVVTIKSLDPDVLEFANGEQTLPIAAGGSTEARFDASGKRIGRARIQMTARVGSEADAFEDVIPVEVLASPETVAAYGEVADTSALEKLTIPDGIVSGFGGLHLELSSTAMVGLGEGARYLVEYPYGCAEQKGSRALAMLLAADLGDAFSLAGIESAKLRPTVQSTMKELEKYQCEDGGFAYWPGACHSTSPYLTSYLLHVFRTAVDLKYDVNADMRRRAYDYLEQELRRTPPENEGWWPAYTAWQAFAAKVLVEGGRNQDSNVNRIFGYRERMPVFGLAYLHDALLARRNQTGSSSVDPRVVELQRRILNSILPEGGSAHVEELNDPYLLWFWNSNVRSTAIVLRTLVASDAADAPIRQLVRWMMAVRKDGRWGNTQENAHAMEALIAYYRKFENAVPDFRAVVQLGKDEIARQEFRGRSTSVVATRVPMDRIGARTRAGTTQPLSFAREGAGTLFYSVRLRYAADQMFQDGLDAGIRIEREYSPYVEEGMKPASVSYKAGDLVRVTLRFHLTKERRYVAATDPLPAGFEPVESWFASTAAALRSAQDQQGDVGEREWFSWWERGGFDHVERHDDRVLLFATRLSEGTHEFHYIARATTAGTFRTAPARAEEMYEPEVFGRTATAVVEVRR